MADAAGERPVPRLMLVADPRRSARSLPRLVAAAIAGGVDGVRFVPPDLPRAALVAMAEEVRGIAAGRATLVVEGDASLAAALGLGLHLAEGGPATGVARRGLGDRAPLGRTVGTAVAARAAVGADYLVAEPVFAAGSTAGVLPFGLRGLGGIVEATWSPVLAGGGVTVADVAAILAAGAHGVAVGGAIAGAADPTEAAAAFRELIDATVPDDDPAVAAEGVAVVVDGVAIEVEPETTVTDLLVENGRSGATVAVRLNGKALARRLFDETILATGDRVELRERADGP